MGASVAATAPEVAPAGLGSRTALTTLVVLVVLSPWAFGSVDPLPTQSIALVSLTVALAALVWDARRGMLLPTPIALWPVAGLWLLAVAQLVPLPEPLHRLIAPGSAAVWHPDVPAAAAALGLGPRPISLHPEATRRSLAFATGILALALVAAPSLRDRRRLLRAASAIVAGGVAVALYGLVATPRVHEQAVRDLERPDRRALRPVREQEPLRRLRRARGAARGRSRHRPRERGAPRARLPELDRELPRAFRRRRVGRRGDPDPRGARLPLARRCRESRGRARGVRRPAPLVTTRLAAVSSRPVGLASGAALVLVALVYVLPAEARDRVLTLAGVTSDQSGSYRLVVWRDTGRLARSSPWVGSGFGAFEDALTRFKTAAGELAVEHAENDYLELLAEGGCVAAGLVVALAALALTRGLRGAASHGDRLARGLATGAAAGFVAIAVHSVVDFNLRIPSNALLCVALFAFVQAVPANARRGRCAWSCRSCWSRLSRSRC